MKKPRKIKDYFSVMLYKCSVAVVANCSEDEAYSWFEKTMRVEKAARSTAQYDAVTSYASNGAILIYFKQWERSTLRYSQLAHESLHAANRILTHVGTDPLGFNNDEPVAYLVQFIMEQSLLILDRK